jgi:hypothetical protein
VDSRLRAAVDTSLAWYDDICDYAQGADLDAMVAAGYALLGPQRVWVREHVQVHVDLLPGPG